MMSLEQREIKFKSWMKLSHNIDLFTIKVREIKTVTKQ